MRKALKERKLQGQLTARASIALTLVALLAAFGCTTNKMPGEGQPYTGGPGFGPTSPTQNIRGTSVPTTPPPMTSSSREQTKSSADMRRLTPDEAAAIMAQYQTQPRVRVLGPVAPGPSNRPYVSDGLVTGQVVTNPAAPATTINSTIYSQQVGSGVTSGVGNEVGAAIFPAESALVTPTNSSAAIPPVTAASSGVTITPTTASAATTSATTATSTLPAPMTSSSASTGTVTSAPVRINTLQSNAATATGSGNVRVLTAGGKVVVTNSGKSQ
jgi:hypothetical protein